MNFSVGDSESGETADKNALSSKEQVHKDLDEASSIDDDDKEDGESSDNDSDIDDRSISLGRTTKGSKQKTLILCAFDIVTHSSRCLIG